MSQGLKKLIFNPCDAPGTSGQEPVDVAARELRKYAEVRIDHNNVIGELGNPDSHYHIMLDAHLDQIGFIITSVDEKAFSALRRWVVWTAGSWRKPGNGIRKGASDRNRVLYAAAFIRRRGGQGPAL
ncbi:MAG: hypothetical protein ACLVHV_02820 [Oscillospiraceae bacterium]